MQELIGVLAVLPLQRLGSTDNLAINFEGGASSRRNLHQPWAPQICQVLTVKVLSLRRNRMNVKIFLGCRS